jgi:hypothetical protein
MKKVSKMSAEKKHEKGESKKMKMSEKKGKC